MATAARLAELATLLKGVRDYRVVVREYGPSELKDGGIVFLHRIVEGGTSKSYGIHVAGLAGIPQSVIARGREVLDELQRGFERESRTPQLAKKKTKHDAQLTLFREPGEEILAACRNTVAPPLVGGATRPTTSPTRGNATMQSGWPRFSMGCWTS